MKTAFVRLCNGCGIITAIDLDPTPEHWEEMSLEGQTVYVIPREEAIKRFKTAGKCKCKQ